MLGPEVDRRGLGLGRHQLGGASDDRLSPVRLVGLPPVRSLFQDAATATDGTLWTWDDQLDPKPVPGLDDVVVLARMGGGYGQPATRHAVTRDGTVWAWGGNTDGQIGNGTTVDCAEPVIVDQLSDVADLICHRSLRYALTRGGDIYGWGAVGFDDSLGATPRLMPLPPATEAATFEKWASIEPAPVGVSTSSPAAMFDLSAGKTFLMHWAAVGDVEQMQALVQQGADVNAVDDDGDTALYYALSNGDTDIVDLLLDHGANPNISGTSGNPLHLAADQGWTGVVSSLIRHGADVDAQQAGGLTASMLAAGTSSTEPLRVLSAAGADLDRLDDDGDSALFYAASRGRVDAVSLLLQRGANPSPGAGASGQTPMSIARILSTSNHPLPPGATRSDYGAIVELLTVPRPKAARTAHASDPGSADQTAGMAPSSRRWVSEPVTSEPRPDVGQQRGEPWRPWRSASLPSFSSWSTSQAVERLFTVEPTGATGGAAGRLTLSSASLSAIHADRPCRLARSARA